MQAIIKGKAGTHDLPSMGVRVSDSGYVALYSGDHRVTMTFTPNEWAAILYMIDEAKQGQVA